VSPNTALAVEDDQVTRPLRRVGGIPKVPGGPVLGAIPELLRDQFAALRRWQHEYGGLFEIDLKVSTVVLAADANTAAEMFVERHRSFARGGPLYAPLLEVFGHSLLTSEGDFWRTRRRAVQPQFRQKVVAAMAPRIDRTLAEILDPLSAGPRDVEHLTGHIAMGVALRVMFGEGLDEARFQTLSTAIDYIIRRIGLGWASCKLPRWLPLPGRRRFRRQLKTLHECIDELVATRRASGELGDDHLGMVLQMADDGTIETEHIRNEAITLIIAGYETTATAMAWSLYEIARTPELHARVQAEADALPDQPTVESLAYTTRVFKEALRMYPSGIWLPRHAAEDSELAGYPIKAGTPVLCSPYLVHRDPHAWDEPERFDPERFAEGSRQPRNRFAFMPFGLGPHMCVGLHLALLEGPLTLARILQRWNLALLPGREPIPRISTTMSSKAGIWLELSPRRRSLVDSR
jgi:enediyne biosynthesis protein E7